MNKDSYRNDIDRIQKLITTLKSDLQKRETKKNLGQPTSMLDGEIRGGLTNLERELDLLKILIEKQTQNKEILPKEAEVRKNKYLEFMNANQNIKSQFDSALTSNKEGLFGNRTQGTAYRDNEHIKGMSDQQLYANQKVQIDDQDKQLDKVIDNLDTLQNRGKQINITVKDQNQQLDTINRDVDKTNQDLIKTNSKLSKFIANSSNCCLWLIIILEIGCLVTISVAL